MFLPVRSKHALRKRYVRCPREFGKGDDLWHEPERTMPFVQEQISSSDVAPVGGVLDYKLCADAPRCYQESDRAGDDGVSTNEFTAMSGRHVAHATNGVTRAHRGRPAVLRIR